MASGISPFVASHINWIQKYLADCLRMLTNLVEWNLPLAISDGQISEYTLCNILLYAYLTASVQPCFSFCLIHYDLALLSPRFRVCWLAKRKQNLILFYFVFVSFALSTCHLLSQPYPTFFSYSIKELSTLNNILYSSQKLPTIARPIPITPNRSHPTHYRQTKRQSHAPGRKWDLHRRNHTVLPHILAHGRQSLQH